MLAGTAYTEAIAGTSDDLDCLSLAARLHDAADPQARAVHPYLFGFYLGRLDAAGLTSEQIQRGMKQRALSPVPEQGPTGTCAAAFETRMKSLQGIMDSDLGALRAKPSK
jgi:hypothetical protein